MTDDDRTNPVTEAFEAQRDRLRAIAYRVLGSHADAEGVGQEAWLRLSRQDAETIANLAGWLTTVVGRLSLDLLHARRTETHHGELPELVVTAADDAAPEDDVALADSVGLALLVVLESLRPGERLAFVLHDLFAVPFDEIAGSSASRPPPPRCSPAARAGRCGPAVSRRPRAGSNGR
ncbi:ECF subfamily RNA polymerase sigma-24 subunit [Amycolatopsis methanolica 239]|uniref:ECF subfamily RNA polymerase sigma-24 subunit n=1 Tax=Amycolatopsis methanolica 239 TaxID=1068978 RepID=A0A076N4Q7_AMYME|nr:ECF subfamily RNA polymerase sigma-24 subunit [Amycolatopsis methanolica 239]